MIKRQTKSELRKQLQQQTQAFLKQGGEVAEVATGATGLVNGSYRSEERRVGKEGRSRWWPEH